MSISIASRKAKGRNFQKWVAKKISKLLGIPYGQDELISSRPMGQSGTDVCLMGEAKKRFPYSIEVKWQETWALPSWIQQTKTNQTKGTDWLLFVKKNRHEEIVVMDAEVFFKIQVEIIKLKEKIKLLRKK